MSREAKHANNLVNDHRSVALVQKIRDIVRNNLRGDEKIIDVRLYEVIDRNDDGKPYHEEIYCVIWFSPSRDEVRQHGTHRVSFNEWGASALCWGGYDMTRDDALIDLDKRMENAPAAA